MAYGSKTFTLKEGLRTSTFLERHFIDFESYLYRCNPVKQNQGRVLVRTQPENERGNVMSPGFSNGFVGAIFQAYNHHKHLILRPDDVWVAITTAFGLFINGGDNAENMKKHFVDFDGKIELKVSDDGTIDTVDWNKLIGRMSDLIEKNTKKDARSWIEPSFTTTTPVCRTVGQVVLMGVMKNYFEYKFRSLCGLPKVTLEGTSQDWIQLKERARRFATFDIDCLSHWSKLLDFVLQKLIDSHCRKVDTNFWSHILTHKSWGSGMNHTEGWINVFMPFCEKGLYRLNDVNPQKSTWGKIDQLDVPPATVEVPVKIDANGREYDTIFYGGHIVNLYDADDDSVRPSLDWAIVDITGSTGPIDNTRGQAISGSMKEYNPEALPKASKFSYGA